MKLIIPAVALLSITAGCAALTAQLGQIGVGSAAIADCMALVKAAINDPNRDTLVDRLKAAGVMCVVSAANDVLTVDAVPAETPALAGAIVAEDAETAAVVRGEAAILAP